MKKYFKLKIPFATKSYIRKKDVGLIIKGNAFFVFDKQTSKYVDEYIEIEKANYRLTDKAMLKPTDYYKNKDVQNFRNNFLDKFNIIDPRTIEKTRHIFLTKEQVYLVNQEFRKMKTTVKKMFSLLSGSNISGAETNHQSSPILCIDVNYYQCNFANVLKKFKDKKYTKISDDLIDKEYSLSDLINNNIIQNFDTIFKHYNENLLYEDKILDVQIEIDSHLLNDKPYEISNKKFRINERQENFIHSYVNKTFENIGMLSQSILKLKLRSFYKQNIMKCIKEKMIPLHSTTIKTNLKQIENAHIISFSSLIKENTIVSLKQAIDPYNCLRIDSSYHTLWDKGEIEFDEKGNLILKNKIIKENYLDIENMPKNTKNYFNEYLDLSAKKQNK